MQRLGSESSPDRALRQYLGGGVAGGVAVPVAVQDVALTAQAYTLVYGDLRYINDVTTGASDAAITLLSASTAGAGGVAVIRKKDSAAGSVVILSGTTRVGRIRTQGGMASFRSDGTNWYPWVYTPPAHPGYVSTRWYPPFREPANYASAAPAAKDTIYAFLGTILEQVTVDQIGVLFTATPTNVNFKLAIYDLVPATPHSPSGAPLLAETADQAASVSQFYGVALGSSLVLRPGFYWFASKWGGAGTLATVNCITGAQSPMIGGATGAEAIGTSAAHSKGWSAADTYANAFPGTFPAPAIVTAATIPVIAFRKA